MVAGVLTDPQEWGLPFGCWTYARLESHINEILLAEGMRWHQQETWFGERVDPDFARKRGRSKPSTAPCPLVAS